MVPFIEAAEMTCQAGAQLLKPGANAELVAALEKYLPNYDDALNEIHERLIRIGNATKLDLAALIGWKHVRNAPWMREMLSLPRDAVERKTKVAFSPGLSDIQRISALDGIPGFGSGGAFTSVLLTAWNPYEFAVFDSRASARGWAKVVAPDCICTKSYLPTYFEHMRRLAFEIGVDWTPRKVDMALFNI